MENVQKCRCEICRPDAGNVDFWPVTGEDRAGLEKAHAEKLKAAGLDMADFLASINQDGPQSAPASDIAGRLEGGWGQDKGLKRWAPLQDTGQKPAQLPTVADTVHAALGFPMPQGPNHGWPRKPL